MMHLLVFYVSCCIHYGIKLISYIIFQVQFWFVGSIICQSKTMCFFVQFVDNEQTALDEKIIKIVNKAKQYLHEPQKHLINVPFLEQHVI